jgi:hypothetical protein
MGTNPFTIPIGTSDPVDICQGLPLYPGLGTARVGASGAVRSQKLFDVSASILIARIKIGSYASWGVGVCGPAIGFLSPNVDVLRENVGNEGRLTLTFNEGLVMEAGLFVGMSIGFGLNASLQVYGPKTWFKPWTLAWQDAFSIDFGFSVDFVSLLFELIQFLLSKNSNSSIAPDSRNRLRDALPDLKRTYAMVDGAGDSSTIEPDLSATPKLVLPFNLANYFAPFKAINDGLSKICGEISFGPSLHLQFPVTFNFSEFTMVGGLAGGAGSAEYGKVIYSGNQIRATGGTRFNPDAKPTRLISHVTYETGFALGISAHFKVSVAKFFSLEANLRTLDLTHVLIGKSQSENPEEVPNAVSTCVENGMVLTPNMTLAFTGPKGKAPNFAAGENIKGTLTLHGFNSANSADVTLEIKPPVPGFPAKVTINKGSQTGSFNFTFQNQCLATGDWNNPTRTEPPSALSPLQSYRVRATLPTNSSQPCSDFEVEMPLNIEERFLHCQREPTHTPAGPAPKWDGLAGGTLNANLELPIEQSKTSTAALSIWFPYLEGEPQVPIPVTFTLLDENRQRHAGSDVVVNTNEGLLPLKPSATGTVTPAKKREGSSRYGLIWRSKGPRTGYSNRFILVVDAGCKYGQTEFWLDVWNWS